jgi:hypothetical protein
MPSFGLSQIYGEPTAQSWEIWAKTSFTTKAAQPRRPEVCMNYPRGGMSVWDWPVD